MEKFHISARNKISFDERQCKNVASFFIKINARKKAPRPNLQSEQSSQSSDPFSMNRNTLNRFGRAQIHQRVPIFSEFGNEKSLLCRVTGDNNQILQERFQTQLSLLQKNSKKLTDVVTNKCVIFLKSVKCKKTVKIRVVLDRVGLHFFP